MLLNGLATALYIGSQFGRGPRDGLMTGLHRRTGRSLRLVRTGLEVTVVLLGLLLGGVAGVGTVLYALAIGPLTQALLPLCTVPLTRQSCSQKPLTRQFLLPRSLDPSVPAPEGNRSDGSAMGRHHPHHRR